MFMSSCSLWGLLYVILCVGFSFNEIPKIPLEHFIKLSGPGITPIHSLTFKKWIVNQLHVCDLRVIIIYCNKYLYYWTYIPVITAGGGIKGIICHHWHSKLFLIIKFFTRHTLVCDYQYFDTRQSCVEVVFYMLIVFLLHDMTSDSFSF